MSPIQKDLGKPKLSRDLLLKHNISFNELVCKSEDLPAWIKPIQETLLRLREKLPYIDGADLRVELQGDEEKFLQSNQDHEDDPYDTWSLGPAESDMDKTFRKIKPSEEQQKYNKINYEINQSQAISEKAVSLRKRMVSEPDWVLLLRENIFRAYHDIHPDPNDHG